MHAVLTAGLKLKSEFQKLELNAISPHGALNTLLCSIDHSEQHLLECSYQVYALITCLSLVQTRRSLHQS